MQEFQTPNPTGYCAAKREEKETLDHFIVHYMILNRIIEACNLREGGVPECVIRKTMRRRTICMPDSKPAMPRRRGHQRDSLQQCRLTCEQLS
jgi:hypothetical protein